MALDVSGIFDAVQSHALASGLFTRVNTHEPKNAPGSGVTCALWVDAIAPVAGASGLASTSGRVTMKVRIYTSMLAEPQDQIDPEILRVVDTLLGLYSGDFELGGRVRNVDLLGHSGIPLMAQAGYINQDGRLMRVMDITLPLIVNDIWAQSP